MSAVNAVFRYEPNEKRSGGVKMFGKFSKQISEDAGTKIPTLAVTISAVLETVFEHCPMPRASYGKREKNSVSTM